MGRGMISRSLLTILLLSAVACGGSSSSPSEADDAGPVEDASPAADASDASAPDSSATDAYVPPSTGGCTYTTVSGMATITAITAPSAGDLTCSNDPRQVTYTFQPDGAAADAGSSREQQFTLVDGDDPPNGCLAALGITVGGRVPATEQMETSGACDPAMYALAVDTSSCTAQCDQ
jgi:hypothetical protein